MARLLLPAVASLLFGLGCAASSNPDVAVSPRRDAGGSGGAGGAATHDASSHDAPGSDVGSGDVVITLSPVLIGLAPVPASSADGGSSPADETHAVVESLAAGSRGMTIARRWDELFTDATSPRTPAWTLLGKVASLARNAGRSLALSLVLIDHVHDVRPAGLDAGWDAPETVDAADRLVDEAFATFGTELAYLSIGREVDRWMSTARAADREAFVSLVKHTLGHARSHADRPTETRVGVTVSSAALVNGALPELAELIAASDVVITTYFPIEPTFEVRPPAGVAGDLDDLVQAAVGDAVSRPVVLEAVGYPSDEKAASSEEKQAAFYDELFQALLSRRNRFPFVGIHALNDLSGARCDEAVEAVGEAGSSAAAAALCSMGVRSRDGTDKLAWTTVVDGIATFASP